MYFSSSFPFFFATRQREVFLRAVAKGGAFYFFFPLRRSLDSTHKKLKKKKKKAHFFSRPPLSFSFFLSLPNPHTVPNKTPSKYEKKTAVECAICLERVLGKEGCRPSDRRFGLLEGCAHAFCLPCIRSWRGQAGAVGGQQQPNQEPNRIDVATSLRTCPLCRTPAWFVTPSATWPATDAARREIVEAYRRSLSRIECRWWDRGRGSCPFGTSCFYLHLDAEGREVARGEGLRFVGDGEGVVKPISQGAKLSDFIDFAVVKRRGGGGRR